MECATNLIKFSLLIVLSTRNGKLLLKSNSFYQHNFSWNNFFIKFVLFLLLLLLRLYLFFFQSSHLHRDRHMQPHTSIPPYIFIYIPPPLLSSLTTTNNNNVCEVYIVLVVLLGNQSINPCLSIIVENKTHTHIYISIQIHAYI